jgi:hypothetical protein
MKAIKYVRIAAALMVMSASTNLWATTGDTSIATLNISGNVPAVFSVTARGLPGDLDLTPGSIVIDRLIGILHFKFNEDAASITVASSTASGQPENSSNVAYSFGSAFKVRVTGTCKSLDTATVGVAGGVALTQAGVDYKSTVAADLTTNVPVGGIEEDCNLAADWHGTTATLPLAGVYAMNITVTMVAN